jgi:hypothetical protein
LEIGAGTERPIFQRTSSGGFVKNAETHGLAADLDAARLSGENRARDHSALLYAGELRLPESRSVTGQAAFDGIPRVGLPNFETEFKRSQFIFDFDFDFASIH